MTTDKTGAQTAVHPADDRFTISVDGKTVGSVYFADRDPTRVFYHSEVDDDYEGRGLATILVGEVVRATGAAGLRIVPVCGVVARYLDKHPEFSDVVDAPAPEIKRWVAGS
ncbi:MAG: N-acetyltransferase [Mycobacteriaceae bacterium]|nr:N-acetyltransferase [Mycobacteriaceae bacterium]MBV9638055.1 N-acetyltransferase [Mycobacteriaceae bacterium]